MADDSNPPGDAVRGGNERNSSTIELFFDLVFVYAITQVVTAIHHDLSLVGLAQGAFLLGLLWWTWTVYTWTTNWSGTDGASIRLFLLAAMGATLFMAMAVPDAFGEGARWFGIAYFTVRLLAAGFYWVASKTYPEQRAAFFTFFPLSFFAAFFVLVGSFLESPWLWILWIAGAALDVFSAINAGKGTWAVDAKHFAERNGLFVIIALGESVVGIGLAAAGVERDLVHTTAIAMAFVTAAALWWSYFDKAAPNAEAHFENTHGKERGRFARDAYSVLHYPLVVGIVFFAVAAEEVVTHPSDPLGTIATTALALGVILVLLAMVAVTYRAGGMILTARIIAAAFIVAVGWLGASLPAITLAAIVTMIVVATLIWEHSAVWTERNRSASV